MKGSAVARSPGVDRKGVDAATSDQRVEAIINEPMAGHPREAIEAVADDPDGEMTALERAGVPGVAVAVVLDRQAGRLQAGCQCALQIGCADAHLSLAGGDAGPSRPAPVSIGSGSGFKCRLR